MTRARVPLAVALAAACAVFVGTTAYRNFTAVRVRAVREAMPAGRDGVQLSIGPEQIRGLTAPFAVIANLRNASQEPLSATIRIDGQEVCTTNVPAARAVRADCQFHGAWDPAIDHEIKMESRVSRPGFVAGSEDPALQWTVEAFEIATHHGSNASIVRLFVLPRDSKAYGPPGIFTCAWLGILLIAGLLIPALAMPRWLRFIHRAVVVVFVLWVAVMTLAPFASPYRVVVSFNTVLGWLVVCFAPQIYRVAKPVVLAAVRWWPSAPAQLKLVLAAGLTVGCFAVVAERLVDVQFDGNRSGLLLLARERVEAIPRLKDREDVKRALYLRDDNGYDGQFMYAIAFDPFLTGFPGEPKAYQPFIDTPPYRYGRVGYPLLTSVLALNRPDRFPAVMIGLIYAGVFLAAVGVGWLAWRSGASPWWALSIALVPGYWMSFRAGLPEPVAAGLAVLGYACVREKRLIPGALLLALACLVRETSVFFVLCITAWLAWTKQPRQALLLVTLALAPLSLWRLYVGWFFFPGWGFFAYWNPPDDFGAPFAGLAALWSDVSAGRYWPDLWDMRRGIIWLSAIVLIAAGLSWTMLRLRPSAVTAAAAVFGVMAICFNLKNVWVGTGNAERLTTDLFLMLAIATPEFYQRSRNWARALTLFWCSVAAYLLFGTLDSAFTRESFLALVGL